VWDPMKPPPPVTKTLSIDPREIHQFRYLLILLRERNLLFLAPLKSGQWVSLGVLVAFLGIVG